jgi:hypothetical protein
MVWKHPKSSLFIHAKEIYLTSHNTLKIWSQAKRQKKALNIIIHFATTKNLECRVRVSLIQIFNGKLRVVGSNKLSTSHSWSSSNLCQHFG